MIRSSGAIEQPPPKRHIKHLPLHRHINRRRRPPLGQALLLFLPFVLGELRGGEFEARRRSDEAADNGVAFVVLVFFHPPMQGFFSGVGEVIQAVGDGEGGGREE